MRKIVVLSFLIVAMATSAMAHFQMLYMEESALNKGGKKDIKLVFNHPFADEHTMEMGQPEEFYVVTKKGKKDLLGTLKKMTFKGNHNSATGYETTYQFRGMGDYTFVLTPAPYLEKSEGAYIQQITKVIANVAGAPTHWDQDLGLKAEIVPLVKPYSVWQGGSFTGVVKSQGKPVPYAEIEVEYLRWDVDLANNAMGTKPFVESPHDSFVTMGIKANKDGEFTFAMPFAGWWGFAALGAGPDTEYKGKELSQDAVIWVQTKPAK